VVEKGIADITEREDRVAEIKAIRDQARADASAVIRTDVPQSLSLDLAVAERGSQAART
jgi:hypothetical protein